MYIGSACAQLLLVDPELAPAPPKGFRLPGLPHVNRHYFSLAHRAMAGIVIRPHSPGRIGPLLFTPAAAGAAATTLVVRNNLTLLQFVAVSGIGGSGGFR